MRVAVIHGGTSTEHDVSLASGAGIADVANLVPVGAIYQSATAPPGQAWTAGSVAAGIATLALARVSLRRCDGELRRWYERHHGSKVID